MEDNLKFPFPAKVVGEDVEVLRLDQTDDAIVTVCERKGKKYIVNILDLKISPDVKGREWITAYKAWLDGDY